MSVDPTQAKSLETPSPEALSPLEISQAMLQAEENSDVVRPLTPLERAATGAPPEDERSRFSRALHSPAVAWGSAALAGIGLVAALMYARRTPAGGRAFAKLKELPSKAMSRRHRKALERALEKPLSFRN